MLVHVLFAVRDRRSLQRLIGDMDEHCIFDIVTTGVQALQACRKAVPDILVIDAVLPGLDGLGVVDRLRRDLGGRMPRVIGGSRTCFGRAGFLRRGADAVVATPWKPETLKSALLLAMADREERIDWEALRPARIKAGELLERMGMHASLKGYAYLSCAAALASENESRLHAIGKGLYAPLAKHFRTTSGNVERLIRHAVESTMSAARARGVYSLFGNTIDPAKGKPTNAQIIALLAQKMRVGNSEQE
ncbi:MAG: response regulator [Clostridiales bacterium]|nr:response regulator [Clostridiales bacterium]